MSPKTTSFSMTDELLNAVKEEARLQDSNVSRIVREAIRIYLEVQRVKRLEGRAS